MTKYTSTSREDLEPMDDAAYINLGADWRMPSLEDADELLDYCTITCSASTVRYTGPNGKSIEFPFAGMKNGDQLEKTKSAFIWTTTMDNSYFGIDGCAIAFAAYYGDSLKDDYSRYYTCLAYRATGLPIRPILKGSRQAAPSRANDASIESKSFVPNTPLHIAPSQRQHK